MPLVVSSEEKEPWIPPQIILIPLVNNTLNNSSGAGDGDAALAHS